MGLYDRYVSEHKEVGYALTKLKGYLRYDTRWEYDDDVPYLVDNENTEPMYTVNYIGPESKRHPNSYAVNVRVNKDGAWTWTTRFFSDVRSTYEKIEDVMRSSSALIEGRAFPHSNGFGLSLYDDDDYEPTIISKIKYYPFSIEDDDEKYYFDEHGNSVKHIWNAIYFGTKEEALDFGNKYLIFGELDVEEVTKTEQVLDESKVDLFNSLLEAIDDFPKNTRAMYRFAKRKHDDTKAIRKVSKEPYWVHPEGVAKIVMEHGGSDVEIKAAMAHDTMEDAGVDYDDMEEKFGEKVASIVKEVTSDKYEIAKVGKEKYISEELCRLSPEALTVKLADMLYNMKDSPTERNYERMRKNIAFLMMNRQLDGVHLALAEEILEV